MNRILLAESMNQSPAGSGFRDLLAASNKFGLTRGSNSSDAISLTELGERVSSPADRGGHLDGLREAMGNIPLFAKMLDHYQNNRLPAQNILKSALEKSPFNVNPSWSAEAAQVFVETGKLTGVIRNATGNMYVMRDAGPPILQEEGILSESDDAELIVPLGTSITADQAATSSGVDPNVATPMAAVPSSNRQFFIAHGRDKTALSQLQSILKELEIPYVVDEEEPHAGRPISQKVSDMMRSCSAGIFIFSGDDDVRDADGVLVKRPRMNVVYELGAASFQYGQRVVIFKEKGVEFPTDFRDLGYIEYERDELSAKSMELLRELIRLKAIKVMAGS